MKANIQSLMRNLPMSEFNSNELLENRSQNTKALWFVLGLVVLLIGGRVAMAQSDERKFEVGGQFSSLGVPTRTVTVTTSGLSIATDRNLVVGLGGRVGYNFSRYLALEAEVNVFPRDRDQDGGRKIQGVFGLRAGKRSEKVGIFAKVRPGFVHSLRGNYELIPGALCGAISPPPITCSTPVSRTNFAVDLGAVVELYPSRRTIVRFDAGDMLILRGFRNAAAMQFSPSGTPGPARVVIVPLASETSHNVQLSFGFGFRF